MLISKLYALKVAESFYIHEDDESVFFPVTALSSHSHMTSGVGHGVSGPTLSVAESFDDCAFKVWGTMDHNFSGTPDLVLWNFEATTTL